MPRFVKELFIGEGSFGTVYSGVWFGNDGNNLKVALKFENKPSTENEHSQLRHEYKVYKELHQHGKVPGFAKQLYFGPSSNGTNGNLLILELLGPSLSQLLDRCNGTFNLKTVLQIADQTLKRLESLHSRNIIHRDIKPDNFCLGLHDNQIYCLDLGLATLYISKTSNKHKPYCDHKSLVGTPRYASINAHDGIRYGRRDDLMSLSYMLIFLLKGSLPWQGVKISDKVKKYNQISHLKKTITPSKLCEDIPQEFAKLLQYCKDLKYDDKPNYLYLRNMFRDLYEANNYHLCNNNYWCWQKDGDESSDQEIEAIHTSNEVTFNDDCNKLKRKKSFNDVIVNDNKRIKR